MLTLACRFFFFNDTATTEIYTLSLHDALPISSPTPGTRSTSSRTTSPSPSGTLQVLRTPRDRKSTRLNSSHGYISYAVFCLKKKKKTTKKKHYPLKTLIIAHKGMSLLPTQART